MAHLKKEFGKHYLVEYIGCDPHTLKKVKEVKAGLLKAAQLSRATVVEHFFYQYKPHGVTGVILISESHFSIHTWPEDQYASFDILTCGVMMPMEAINYLKNFFKAKRVRIKIFSRGY